MTSEVRPGSTIPQGSRSRNAWRKEGGSTNGHQIGFIFIFNWPWRRYFFGTFWLVISKVTIPTINVEDHFATERSNQAGKTWKVRGNSIKPVSSVSQNEFFTISVGDCGSTNSFRHANHWTLPSNSSK